MKTVPVSLIIPTHNRVQRLARLLKSLNKLNPKPIETIIVNDGSKDRTQDLLEFWEDKKTNCLNKLVINNKFSKGPAFARNQGIIISNQKYLAFTDDDVIVDSSWIKMIFYRLPKGDSSLGGVGGKVIPINNDILSQYYYEIKVLDPPRQLQYLVTVNCCIKRECFEKVGLFDESFTIAGGEDTELSLRLKKANYQFAREKDAIVYHDFSPNFWHFCKMWIRYGKGTKMALIKNRR